MQKTAYEMRISDWSSDVCSAEDIDIGIRDGLGLRWSFMGPYETIDLNAPGGVRDYVARYESLYVNLWSSQQHIVPWGGETVQRIEADRAEKLRAEERREGEGCVRTCSSRGGRED